MNQMKNVRIEKVTLNIGAGSNPDKLKKGVKLLEALAGIPPVKTVTEKRLPAWNIRPGLPIGAKITLRGKPAKDMVVRLLTAKTNKLKQTCFDNKGNVSFGVHEYIDIPNLNYDPEIGIMGLQICITLERPGFRIKRRKICMRKMHKSHEISQQDGIEFFKKEFNVSVEE